MVVIEIDSPRLLDRGQLLPTPVKSGTTGRWDRLNSQPLNECASAHARVTRVVVINKQLPL